MLAPDKQIVVDYLTELIEAHQTLSLAAISVQQTQLFPLDSPPDWLTTVNDNLTAAQTVANDWLTNKGPQVIAGIPQTFVSYSNSMQVIADAITSNTTPTDALTRIKWLKKHVDRVPDVIATLQLDLTTGSTSLRGYQSIIETTLTDVQTAMTSETTDVTNVSDQISSLFQDIDGATVTASNGMTGVISSGGSLAVALLGYGYAAATTLNPALPIVGIIVALGGITYSAITNAVNEQKIVDKLGQIRDLQVTLSEDKQVLAILLGMQTMLDKLDKAIIAIKDAIDISSIWTDEQTDINDLVTKLTGYTGKVMDIDDIATLSQAADVWKDIAASANNIQKSAAGIATGGTINLSISKN